MLDTAIASLVDRLIQLLTARDEGRQAEFEQLMRPMFEDATLVAQDYMTLLADLVSRIQRGDDIVEVIRWLEHRRMAQLSVRLKLRAALVEFYHSAPRSKADQNNRSPQDRFRNGIIGLLSGGLSLVQEGHIEIAVSADPRDRGDTYRGHTILDILYGSVIYGDSRDRERMLSNAASQRRAVEAAWREATEAYAALSKAQYGRV